MGEWELNFEPGDLAGMVWAAIAVLGVVETIRYVRWGRRPGSLPARAAIIAVAGVVLLSLILTGRLAMSQISHGWACLILALLVLPWVGRSYQTTTRPVPAGTLFMLRGLRVAAALIALLMVARPVLLWTIASRERAVVGILLDTSQSMNVRDVVNPTDRAKRHDERSGGVEPISRLEAVERMFESSRDARGRLEDKLDVQYMAFDARVRRVEERSPPKAQGSVTAVGRSVDAARETLLQTGSRIAGLVLISDGRDTSSSDHDPLQAGDELAVAGIPLYCVGVGDELPAGQTRSLSGRRLDMPDRITVLNRLAVGAEFLAAGLVGSEIEVRLEYDGKPAGLQKITPTQIRELIRADLSHVPTEGGLHQVTVLATVADLGEAQDPVKLSRYIRVTDDKVQVLYIDRARYERAAIARALEYAKDINLTKIDLDRPANAPVADLLPAAPTAWRTYHVVIIGDVARDHLTDAAMKSISQLVTIEGRGAVILGGTRTLGSGDYAGTPLDALFPADLATRGQLPDAVAFELTPAGMLHPICRIADDSSDPWKTLPPFAGASRLGPPPPTAEVLIRAASGEPLMVVQQKGAGRSAAIAFDSSWQWPFANNAGLDLHRRFWRQLVFWLANRKPEVWTLAERSQYDYGRLRAGDERVIVRAGINEPSTGGLPAQSSVEGEIVDPNGQARPLAWSAAGEGFEARPTIDQPGKYRVRVEGKVAGQSSGTAETGFVVESIDREMSEPFADLESLKRMAARTAPIGGEYVPVEQFSQLLEKIRAGAAESRVIRVQRHYLVDNHPWWWLGLFVGLLTIEWVIRRRVGLV